MERQYEKVMKLIEDTTKNINELNIICRLLQKEDISKEEIDELKSNLSKFAISIKEFGK